MSGLLALVDRAAPQRDAPKELFAATELPDASKLEDVMVRDLLVEPDRMIWDHNGHCHCGRRTYLFSQYDK